MNIFGKARRAFLLTGHARGLIRETLTSHDGSTVITRGDDGVVIAWDVQQRRARWAQTCDDERLGMHHGFASCALLDDDHVIMDTDERLRIVRISDGSIACEHRICALDLVGVTRNHMALCKVVLRPIRGRFAVIDPWTLKTQVCIGAADSPHHAVLAGGSMVFLTTLQAGNTSMPAPCECWHIDGLLAGTLAWRLDGDRCCAPCVTGIDRVAVWWKDGITELDLVTGQTIAHWPLPSDNPGELRLVGWRLMRTLAHDGPWKLVEGDGDPVVEIRCDGLPCDPWQRDHADSAPADARPILWGNCGWESTASASQPVAISANNDGLVVVATGDGTVVRWDLNRHRLIERTRLASPCAGRWPSLLAVGDLDGRFLTWVDAEGRLGRINVATGVLSTPIGTGLVEPPCLLAASETTCLLRAGNRYVDSNPQPPLIAVDIATGHQLWQRDSRGVRACTCTPDGQAFALLIGRSVHMVAAETGIPLGPPTTPSQEGRGYADGPIAYRDGRFAFSAFIDGLVTWTPDDPDRAFSAKRVNEGISALAIVPGGRFVVAAEHYTDRITVIDPVELRHRRLLGHIDTVTALAVTPDGRRLISASEDGYVIAWSTTDWTRQVQAALLPTAHGQPQGWWAVTADGTMSGSEGYQAWVNPLA